MPAGPGKYDDLATYVRENSNAKGVVVIVLGGDRGSGFSVQMMGGAPRDDLWIVPLLEDVVAELKKVAKPEIS